MASSKCKNCLMTAAYFGVAGLIMAFGATILFSGLDGYVWYQASWLGQYLHIPALELYKGTGAMFMAIGVILTLLGLIEHFFCPSCPFSMVRGWQAPGLRNDDNGHTA